MKLVARNSYFYTQLNLLETKLVAELREIPWSTNVLSLIQNWVLSGNSLVLCWTSAGVDLRCDDANYARLINYHKPIQKLWWKLVHNTDSLRGVYRKALRLR